MDTLHKAATNIQRITRGHITRINKWNYIQVEAFIPDFFDPNGRVSTPAIPTELLLPIRFHREDCLFKVDVIYDDKNNAYCFIFVEDNIYMHITRMMISTKMMKQLLNMYHGISYGTLKFY